MDMDMSPYTGSNYIKATDLEPRVRYEVTVLGVTFVDFEQEDGSVQRRPVFQTDWNGKKLVNNPTRAKVFVRAWGPNGNTYIGKMFVMYRGMTNFGTDKVPCIEVEPVVTDKIPQAAPKRAIEAPPPPPDPNPNMILDNMSDPDDDPDEDIPI
jgi:hypothetical protein